MRSALILAVVAVAGCGGFEERLILGPDDVAWRGLLEERGIEGLEVPHPLAATDAMREEALRLAGYGRARDRLKRLQTALFDPQRFPFQYETEGTLTAAEAFDQRRGNCLSFTNLFIAMSRSLDIDVYGAFPIYRGRSERKDDFIVINNHVVAAYDYVRGVDVFDFDRERESPSSPVQIIGDDRMTALYLNNRGVEKLREGSVASAVTYLDAAVRLDPVFAGAWGNLGVARRRSGDTEGALAAYRRALELEPGNPTILANLAGLYRLQGREREARNAVEAADLRQAPSHMLLVRGDLERAEGRLESALRYYRRAHRLDRKLSDPLVAIARVQWELGNDAPARKALRKALARDPDHEEALRLSSEWSAAEPEPEAVGR